MCFKTSVFEYLMGGQKGDRLTGVCSERTRGRGQKMKQGKDYYEASEQNSLQEVFKHWNRLFRKSTEQDT